MEDKEDHQGLVMLRKVYGDTQRIFTTRQVVGLSALCNAYP